MNPPNTNSDLPPDSADTREEKLRIEREHAEQAEQSLLDWIDGAIAKMNDPTYPRPKVW